MSLNNKKILFAGTTSSGSSALFDYFRCFKNVCAIENEMPKLWRNNLYPKWKKENFSNTEYYKKKLNKQIEHKFNKEFENIDKDSILLLNNVVTCLTLPGISLLDNSIVVCVIRDPRSTWLRRKEVCMELNITVEVEQFIKGYRGQRELFSEHLKNLNCSEKIYIVNFEDFILSKKCKTTLVRKLGFNISCYPKSPEYAPYPKEQSILRHHKYENQAEIELIKTELGKYCHAKV